MSELELMAEADRRAKSYLEGIEQRSPFPDQAARAGLSAFWKHFFDERCGDAVKTLQMLDDPAARRRRPASNGPRYFGFVIGAALPGSGRSRAIDAGVGSVRGHIRHVPGRSDDREDRRAVASSTRSTYHENPRSGSVPARRPARSVAFLRLGDRCCLRQGQDIERDGLFGAPEIRVVVSETVHYHRAESSTGLMGFGFIHLVTHPWKRILADRSRSPTPRSMTRRSCASSR